MTPSPEHQELVHLEVASGIATISLDSPHNRNALSRRLQQQLASHVKTAVEDTSVRVILLTHRGPVFCAGGDLKEQDTPGERNRPESDGYVQVLDGLWRSPKPVVGRIAGPARGGGMGLVAVCDLVVATEDTTFAFPEVRLGVVPAVISVPLRRRIPHHALRRLFLTGETFGARHAEQIGLVTSTVTSDGLDGEVFRLCSQLVRGAPDALAATKALLRADTPCILDECALMLKLSLGHFASEEAQEGIDAFRTKRTPSWVPDAFIAASPASNRSKE
ncbi:enoyl-CoA hydratase-related protein [Burkholderia multivorans]|uniref:enoyl-CoA hydratase-related protein n=1 Tax=Burkholderia multivorans TaxID=87883 RepID=UPI0019CFD135|nr:enoyl-CoA hydratase-related protein [Burkholderia multivorans]MBN6731262.1 enoyl-CoA hydratase/isomerase family protein [Burkholderia multivorans]MBN6733468.1 enoyl-CoA hydratase/isomerase family protein [Burkholderia multivorans]MBN7130332.1 enoyl-CoA hydratase [Burkholderia multivorans]MBN8165076.1 enoyl-CoA hydratase [Burkholderia multivorans]MBN8170865.1 enoyl-CoA hydratase [Burkholderia multivorans]